MKRTLLALCAVVLVTAGCPILPRTSGLKQVHELYREEFSAAVLALPEQATGATGAELGGSFERTLQSIRKYRDTFGKDSREAAHLIVLQGMIYLQTGRPGMARLLTAQVRESRAKLVSSADIETRDSLFALCYEHLVDGWQEVWEFSDDEQATVAERQKLEAAADGIVAALSRLSQKSLADLDVDSGAIYLANTAAIFMLWAYKIGSETRDPDAPAGSRPPLTESDLPAYAAKGRDAIAPYLTPEELTAARTANPLNELAGEITGRFRYLEWYRWLDRKAATATP